MKRLSSIAQTLLLVALMLPFVGCEKKVEKAQLGINSEAFYEQYNEYICGLVRGRKAQRRGGDC